MTMTKNRPVNDKWAAAIAWYMHNNELGGKPFQELWAAAEELTKQERLADLPETVQGSSAVYTLGNRRRENEPGEQKTPQLWETIPEIREALLEVLTDEWQDFVQVQKAASEIVGYCLSSVFAEVVRRTPEIEEGLDGAFSTGRSGTVGGYWSVWRLRQPEPAPELVGSNS